MAPIKPSMMNFARDLLVRGLDSLAERVDPPADESRANGLQKLAASWQRLDQHERDELIATVAAAAEMAAITIPVAVATVRRKAGQGAARVAAKSARPAARAIVRAAKPAAAAVVAGVAARVAKRKAAKIEANEAGVPKEDAVSSKADKHARKEAKRLEKQNKKQLKKEHKKKKHH